MGYVSFREGITLTLQIERFDGLKIGLRSRARGTGSHLVSLDRGGIGSGCFKHSSEKKTNTLMVQKS